MRRSYLAFLLGLLIACSAAAQDGAEHGYLCSPPQVRKSGSPVEISPAIFNTLLKKTPSSPNPSHLTGFIMLRVLVNEHGNIVDACGVRSTGEGLADDAIQTAKTWQATPYLVRGKAITFVSFVGVWFKKDQICFEPMQSPTDPHTPHL